MRESQERPAKNVCEQSWLGWIIMAVVFVAAIISTWRKWPDLLVDFGVQLYVPWVLAKGSVLYRDVAYLTGGPLSQYYHALLFKLFGVSFLTVAVSNLVVVALLLGLIYHWFKKVADQLTGIMVGLTVLLAFAFAHRGMAGIFNYVTPYSEECFHGLALSLLAVVLLVKWFSQEKLSLAAAAGFIGGLVFLTKGEVFLALFLTILGALVLHWLARGKRGFVLKSLVLMAGAGLVPLLGFFFYFFRVESFSASWRSVFWAWVPIITTPTANNPFYQWCMGWDVPRIHLELMLIHFAVVTGLIVAFAFLFRHPARSWLGWPVWLVATIFVAYWASDFGWDNCGRSLPLFALTALAVSLGRVKRTGWTEAVVFRVLWAVLSVALLLKMGLHCRIWHYGFILAMPAFVATIDLLLWVFPGILQEYNVQAGPFRTVMSLMLLIGLMRLGQDSQYIYRHKTLAVGEGSDRMFTFPANASPAAVAVKDTVNWLQTNTPPDATLAVLPSGCMINYLTRRINPTGYLRWNLTEMQTYGQANMTDNFIKHSPDYIVLIAVDNGEFGLKYFGQEKKFGLDLMQWIDRHYGVVVRMGHEWLQDGGFGIKILKRNAVVIKPAAQTPSPVSPSTLPTPSVAVAP